MASSNGVNTDIAFQDIIPINFAPQTNLVAEGTSGDDTLEGTEEADTLDGRRGDDQLFGFGDNDSLNGGGGKDSLDGGSGSDTMTGGARDDIYYVDSVGDTTIEKADQGLDRVYASINWTLEENVENLILQDSATTGTGNDLNNKLKGNELDNILNGLQGNDKLIGKEGADELIGGGGDDTLIGVNRKGAEVGIDEVDTLTGGGGADEFVLGDDTQVYYSDVNDGPADYGIITDFSLDEGDVIVLNGSAADYELVQSGDNTRIIWTAGVQASEPVGLMLNTTATDLNLNSSAFEYTGS